MRLLLYGLNYAPEPTGIGKYTGELGEWLAGRGHSVDAIVAPPYYPQWEVPAEYQGEGFVSEDLGGVKVHRAPIYVPAPDKIRARVSCMRRPSVLRPHATGFRICFGKSATMWLWRSVHRCK